MSNLIQVRRGPDSDRVKIIFADGELVWTTDSELLYVGDGVSMGGVPVASGNLAYVRNAFSQRFNIQVDVSNVIQALDFIFNFSNNVATNYYYGDISTNATIANDTTFMQALTGAALPPNVGSYLDVIYHSNSTYRVFAYPMSYGALVDIQDPNFSYASIANSYEPVPRQVTYQGIVFYVYITQSQNLSLQGKTIRYVFS